MLNTLVQALATGLSLWESKEKTKYIDRIIEIKRLYREELSKPDNYRSDDVLTRLELELRDITDAFSASVKVAKDAN